MKPKIKKWSFKNEIQNFLKPELRNRSSKSESENKIQTFLKTKKRKPIFEIRFSDKTKSENEIPNFLKRKNKNRFSKNEKRNPKPISFSKTDRRFKNFKNRYEFSENNPKSTYWKIYIDYENSENFWMFKTIQTIFKILTYKNFWNQKPKMDFLKNKYDFLKTRPKTEMQNVQKPKNGNMLSKSYFLKKRNPKSKCNFFLNPNIENRFSKSQFEMKIFLEPKIENRLSKSDLKKRNPKIKFSKSKFENRFSKNELRNSRWPKIFKNRFENSESVLKGWFTKMQFWKNDYASWC